MIYRVYWRDRYSMSKNYEHAFFGEIKDHYTDINEAFKAANSRAATHPDNEYIVREINE